MLLQHLLDDGLSKTAIAQRLGVSRRVIYHWLATGQLARDVDEIGYLPISRTGAMLFFQLMSRRYEHGSTVLTSNKGFEEWVEIFGDEVMAAALIDRLVHHCHIVNIRGNSYRMRHHTELHRALGTARSADTPARSRSRTKEAQAT